MFNLFIELTNCGWDNRLTFILRTDIDSVGWVWFGV